jgi:hypothetical protein
MPAHDAIAQVRIVAWQFETARPVFKFDSHSLLGVAAVLIGDAVGVGRSDFLDAEFQFVRHSCEKENHSHFAFRSVLQWCTLDWDRSAEFGLDYNAKFASAPHVRSVKSTYYTVTPMKDAGHPLRYCEAFVIAP